MGRKAQVPGPASNAQVAARPYRAAAPAKIDRSRKYPLLLVLHGFGGNGEKVEDYYGYNTLVDELGFIAVYPEGTEESRRRKFWQTPWRFWNATDACCNFFHATVDDVAYLDAVIDDAAVHFPIDAKRVFITGLSNGGYMAYRYACDRAHRVAAIANHAGAMWSDTTRCKPSEPVAILHIHGTADERVPYEGRAGVPPDEGATPSARDGVNFWARVNGCGLKPESLQVRTDMVISASEAQVQRWNACRGAELWTLHGVNHVPPLNRQAWARTVFGWLAEHPKP